MDQLLTEKEVATMLRCSLSKLRADRWKGIGLPYFKETRRVLYGKGDVERHLRNIRIETKN